MGPNDLPFPRRMQVLVLLALAAVIYLGTASWPPLIDDADASHALVSREMNATGDYVVMRLDGVRYLQKAPLHYWMVAGLFRVLGENAFATRLPDALAMLALVLMVYLFGRRFFGDRAGFYGGLATATGIGFWMFTRIMIPEAIYTFFFVVIFYLFLRAWTGSLDPRIGYWGAAAAMALAVLTRALIAVIFPLAIVFLFLVATGGWRRWRELRIFSSAGIFLLIAAPWHIMAELRAPGFAWWYFINEHFKRAVGSRWPPDYDAVPLWAWLLAHLAWWFPWSIFLVLLAKLFPAPRKWRDLDAAGQARLLLFIWAGFILFFFSMTGGSRMEYYAFAAWPAVTALLGLAIARAEEEGSPWLRRSQAALAALGLVIAAGLGYAVWASFDVSSTTDISKLLQTRETDFYRVSMAHLLDLRPRAFAVLRGPAIGAALSFLLGFGLAWLLRRRARHVAATLAVALAMAGFAISANFAFKQFGPHMSSHELARAVVPFLRSQDQLVVVEFDSASSLVFYTGRRRAYVWREAYHTLESMAKMFPDSPKIFLDDPALAAMWRGPTRVFLSVPAELQEKTLAELPADSMFLLEEFGGKAIYVNERVRPEMRSVAELAQRR
ncbi:MAG: glycosyltransferase family 39 protein [Candidatus Koribacter versatilis]|uniref:Glycosyltransferase family 39 protein n=1 Tax=Candidatus Korobacter versatilis TaxID=658062 RepID=A0A932A8F2_9BACT|nr:glycosyltransferase family 39 protein [Candidatus Koribacter versatilis]